MIYVRKYIKDYYIELPDPIDEEYYEGQIGETYLDFLDGKWILLSDEQVSFHEEHPGASIESVLNKVIINPESTLELAKAIKKKLIEEYDKSPAVNSFTINGVLMWLTVEERLLIATLINANESIGREQMTRWFNGQEFTFPISTWKLMLIALEIYAGDALNVTEYHKSFIDSADSIDIINKYNYKLGYPNKLIF